MELRGFLTLMAESNKTPHCTHFQLFDMHGFIWIKFWNFYQIENAFLNWKDSFSFVFMPSCKNVCTFKMFYSASIGPIYQDFRIKMYLQWIIWHGWAHIRNVWHRRTIFNHNFLLFWSVCICIYLYLVDGWEPVMCTMVLLQHVSYVPAQARPIP